MKFKNELGVWYTQTVFLDTWPILPPSLLVRLSCLDEGCVEWWPKIEVTFQVLWLSIQRVITVYINSAFHLTVLCVFFLEKLLHFCYLLCMCVVGHSMWQRTTYESQFSLPYGPLHWSQVLRLGDEQFYRMSHFTCLCGSYREFLSIISSDLPTTARADRTGIIHNERNLSQGMFWWLSQLPNPVDSRAKPRPRFSGSHCASPLEDLIIPL